MVFKYERVGLNEEFLYGLEFGKVSKYEYDTDIETEMPRLIHYAWQLNRGQSLSTAV